MGDTIEGMDTEMEQKDNKTDFLEIKKALPDSQNIDEMNKLRLNKNSSERRGERITDRTKCSLENHKNLKNRKQ